ncbi:hypothetical protein ACH5RR_026776 [Cinchona calisaya]|uniref:Uncharacterized protein n=1 Tax=Cinchona calisaya TaxID=153742 RepID=A0ABD2Z5I7_9GENT
MPKSSSNASWSQQQSYVQQSDKNPYISNILASIPILVKAKSSSARSIPDTAIEMLANSRHKLHQSTSPCPDPQLAF